jgi:hypothetical protein
VDWEWQMSGFPCPFNHASDAHAPKRLAALIHKDVGAFAAVSFVLPL